GADGRELSESTPAFRPGARRMESGRTEPPPVMRGPARGSSNTLGVGGAGDLTEADPQESARNEAGVADSASELPAAGETVAQASRERQVRVVGSHGDLPKVRRPVPDGFTPPVRGDAQEGRTPRRTRKGESPGGPRARRAATGKRPHLYLVPPLDEDAPSGPSRWGRNDGGPVRTGEQPAESDHVIDGGDGRGPRTAGSERPRVTAGEGPRMTGGEGPRMTAGEGSPLPAGARRAEGWRRGQGARGRRLTDDGPLQRARSAGEGRPDDRAERTGSSRMRGIRRDGESMAPRSRGRALERDLADQAPAGGRVTARRPLERPTTSERGITGQEGRSGATARTGRPKRSAWLGIIGGSRAKTGADASPESRPVARLGKAAHSGAGARANSDAHAGKSTRRRRRAETGGEARRGRVTQEGDEGRRG